MAINKIAEDTALDNIRPAGNCPACGSKVKLYRRILNTSLGEQLGFGMMTSCINPDCFRHYDSLEGWREY